jgi:hypothetical protein
MTFHFCPECGSTLFWEPERIPQPIGVAVGAVADPSFPQPERSTTNTPGLALPGDIRAVGAMPPPRSPGGCRSQAGSRESRRVRRSAAEKELCNKTIITPYEISDKIPVTRSLGRSAAGEGRTIRGRSGSGERSIFGARSCSR